MSNVNEIQFAVEQEVLDIGVKIVFPIIEGMDNRIISPEWMEKRQEIIQHLLEEYKDIDYHADPILEGFHILHDRAGVKRRKNIPASCLHIRGKNFGRLIIEGEVFDNRLRLSILYYMLLFDRIFHFLKSFSSID